MNKGRIFLVVIDGLPVKMNRNQSNMTLPGLLDINGYITLTEVKEKDVTRTENGFVTFFVDDGALNIKQLASPQTSFRDGYLYCSFYVQEIHGSLIMNDRPIVCAKTLSPRRPFIVNTECILRVMKRKLKEVELYTFGGL